MVTGAGSGIGEAVSLELVRRGVKAIALVDQTDAVSHLAESIDQFTGKRVHAVAYQSAMCRTTPFAARCIDEIVLTLGHSPHLRARGRNHAGLFGGQNR